MIPYTLRLTWWVMQQRHLYVSKWSRPSFASRSMQHDAPHDVWISTYYYQITSTSIITDEAIYEPNRNLNDSIPWQHTFLRTVMTSISATYIYHSWIRPMVRRMLWFNEWWFNNFFNLHVCHIQATNDYVSHMSMELRLLVSTLSGLGSGRYLSGSSFPVTIRFSPRKTDRHPAKPK